MCSDLNDKKKDSYVHNSHTGIIEIEEQEIEEEKPPNSKIIYYKIVNDSNTDLKEKK